MQDKPTLFIHAGAGKTGTSFLQVLFARHRDQMLDAGLVYPDDPSMAQARAGQVTSGNGVEFANYLRPNLPHQIADKNAFADKLRQDLAQAQGRNLLYSSEFIVFPNNDRSATIRGVIEAAGYRPRVIFLARDLAPAVHSVYSQQVKRAGEIRPLSAFIDDWDPHYKAHIMGFEQTFGREPVTVFNYDAEKSRLADLFFRRILGLPFVPEETTRINRSLTLKEIELLRTMNAQIPAERRAAVATFASDAIMGVAKPDTAPVLTHEEMRKLSDRFGATLPYINSFIAGEGVSISRTPPGERKAVETDDFETTVVAILSRLINRTV